MRTSRTTYSCLLLVFPVVFRALFAAELAGGVAGKLVLDYREPQIPMIGSSIPGLKVQEPGKCGYIGLQYGTNANEIAYLIFDYDGRKGMYRRMYVYVPGHAEYGKPLAIMGSRDSARGSVRFRQFGAKSMFGDIGAAFKIGAESVGTVVDFEIECTVTAGASESCRFTLSGRRDVGASIDRPPKITGILGNPEITCGLDHRSVPPKLAGRLKMGVWDLIPENNMPCRLRATIVDRSGKRQAKETAKLDEMNEGKFRFLPDKPLIPGRRYEAHVTVDLGDVFGTAELTQKVTPHR